ncbi:hypothetical protein GYB22_02050 [bacterium]|nr:hypothetical protein [bacterium]
MSELKLTIKEVVTLRDAQVFNDFPRWLYTNDPYFISHLDQDIEKVFNPKTNSSFRNGDAKRWLLFDGKQCTGKIAAFFDRDKDWAGIGFFDCVDDQESANMLFRTAEEWLSSNGFNYAEAPVNFGERDKYWGLMIHSSRSQSYQENYNADYYRHLFERAGYQKKFEQTTAEADPKRFNHQKFKELAQRSTGSEEFELKHLERDKLDKYAEDFVSVYNKAWQGHDHFTPLTKKRILQLFKSMKPVLREDLIWFTYANDKPVAFYVSIIDLNQIFKYLNGKLNWWGKLKFLWYKNRVKVDKIRGLVFGVIPEYQNRGLYSGMIMKIYEVFEKDPYLKSTELSWIGDFNPKMHALFRSLGAETTKIHYTYEKRF